MAELTRFLAAALAAAFTVAQSAEKPVQPAEVADALRRVVHDRVGLVDVYAPTGFAPLWLNADLAVLNNEAYEAIQLIESAANEGLDPADYHVVEVRAFAAALREHPGQPDVVARLDSALSEAMLRYVHDLHMGRIDPRDLGVTLDVSGDAHEFATLLRDAVAGGRLVETARAWAPLGSQYPALNAALAWYRTLALRGPVELLPIHSAVHPGERYGSLGPLRERLVLLGDLDPGGSSTDQDIYEGAIVDGVKRFQRRHGLEPDGVLGTQTLAQFAVPLEWRARQLELAMERLRWLPHLGDERLVLVNIPMFRLFASDSTSPTGSPSFTSDVIVGRAHKTETPEFAATLTEIQFRPYWNVPASILRKEILPQLAREPDYLGREQMELVAGQGDASPVVPATDENLLRLRRGGLRLRQRAGPANALGLIKFLIPNEHDVYMHATPAPALFARSRRDFSHGCVRVADPVGLAEWVLKTEPGWGRQRITAAMDASEPSRVSVRSAVRVMLFYSTAAVLPDSGDVVFADDIYGRDAPLDRALRER